MVHSACQCDSVTGLGTDIWPNVIPDASICQMFLGEINTWISGLSKQMPSLTWEELHPIIWRTGWNSNGGKRNSCLTAELGHGSFPTFGLELKHWLFLGLQPARIWTRLYTIVYPTSQAFRLKLELHHSVIWVSSLWSANFGAFSASILVWTDSW